MNLNLIVAILFITNLSFAQIPVHTDSLFNFIKYNSVHRNKADWKKEYTLFQSCLQSAKSAHDSMSCVVDILEHLGDVHTQIYLSGNFYGHYPQLNEEERGFYSALMKLAEKHVNAPEIRLEKDILYILVPSFRIQPNEVNKYGQLFYDSVLTYATKNIRGIILDFRFNTGGNAYPMLTGLSAFLGDGDVIFETEPNGEIIRRWRLENGNLLINNHQVTQIKSGSPKHLKNIPIVVLVGPVTMSSGFVSAVAFRGRKNTLLMGQESVSGFTTSNGYFEYPPNLIMNLSTNYIADRNKTIYPEKLIPDLITDTSNDEKLLQKAIDWLNNQP